MNNKEIIKQQICNITESLLRNINENFLSVSFSILERGNILIRIILKNITAIEKEYIDDFIAELEATQNALDSIEKVDCFLEGEVVPFEYEVYSTS